MWCRGKFETTQYTHYVDIMSDAIIFLCWLHTAQRSPYQFYHHIRSFSIHICTLTEWNPFTFTQFSRSYPWHVWTVEYVCVWLIHAQFTINARLTNRKLRYYKSNCNVSISKQYFITSNALILFCRHDNSISIVLNSIFILLPYLQPSHEPNEIVLQLICAAVLKMYV